MKNKFFNGVSVRILLGQILCFSVISNVVQRCGFDIFDQQWNRWYRTNLCSWAAKSDEICFISDHSPSSCTK